MLGDREARNGGGEEGCNRDPRVHPPTTGYKFPRQPTIPARACAPLMDFRKTGVRTATRHRWYAIRHERDSDGAAN